MDENSPAEDTTLSQTKGGNKRSHNHKRDANDVLYKSLARTVNSAKKTDIRQLNDVGVKGELIRPMKLSHA